MIDDTESNERIIVGMATEIKELPEAVKHWNVGGNHIQIFECEAESVDTITLELAGLGFCLVEGGSSLSETTLPAVVYTFERCHIVALKSQLDGVDAEPTYSVYYSYLDDQEEL